MKVKADITWRIGLVYFGMFSLAIAIFLKILYLQFVEGSYWREKVSEVVDQEVIIPANRGDILSCDGSKLACSVPSYYMRMDTRAAGLSNQVFNANIDSLALCLSRLVGDRSPGSYRRHIAAARQRGERYFLVSPHKISFMQLKKAKTFPIFRLGPNKGGFVAEQHDERRLPFGILAGRTIGKLSADASIGGMVGIENAFNEELKGVDGVSTFTRMGGRWTPEEDEAPVDGLDVVSTIDVRFQDVAESSLKRQLIRQNADHGVAILMEVETGEVKAIVNLHRQSPGVYVEDYYNYAIGEAIEPGSTFKLASLMAALEDGEIDLDDKVDTRDGTFKYYDRVMKDSHEGGFGVTTIRNAFHQSSNVGISRVIYEKYKSNPAKFVDRLYDMNLNEPLGIEIKGETAPQIKYPGDPLWSGISLPWMSIGYEVKQTPLQVLTFYNAVANDGTMVKPRFIKGFAENGKMVKKFDVEVINSSICSGSTLRKAKELLLGVVEEGTANNIKTPHYQIAGKTGTAQIAKGTLGYKSKGVIYQASFVGYYPANNPKYSCIVSVNAPSNNVYYGNIVAGNVFKEIADRTFAFTEDLREDFVYNDKAVKPYMPVSKGGYRPYLEEVMDELDIDYEDNDIEEAWVETKTGEEEVTFKNKTINKGLVPNVQGMGAMDAVTLLENLGLRVKVVGVGKVVSQSARAGSRYGRGQYVVLKLG